MEPVRTYITGLDRLIGGGLPKGSCILLRGPPGVGKTILGLQFLFEGYEKEKSAGMLIQIEEFDTTLDWYNKTFDWDLGMQQKKGKLAMFSFKPKNYDKFQPSKIDGEFLGKLKDIIGPMGIQRVVIDSITPLEVALDNDADYRRSFYETVEFFKKSGATTVIISDDRLSLRDAYEAEEHICDGVIKMRNREENGEFKKELMVSKMTATRFPMAWFPVSIKTGVGISIKPFL